MECSVIPLAGSHAHIFEAADPRFVQRKRRGKLIETHAAKRKAASECGQRLAEDRISLPSAQLSQQSG